MVRRRTPLVRTMATTRSTPARSKSRPQSRARRSSAPALPRLPVVEQRHVDGLGLGAVALGIFLVFPLWLGWEGGFVGQGVVGSLAWLVGVLRYAAPVAFVAGGALLVLRPVLPAFRPFRSGALCLFAALALALAAGTLGIGPGGRTGEHWSRAVFEDRGGILGEAELRACAALLGTVGAHIVAICLLLAAATLLTGASVASVLRAGATVAADTTRTFRTRERLDDDADWEDGAVAERAPTARRAKPKRPALVDDDAFPEPADPDEEPLPVLPRARAPRKPKAVPAAEDEDVVMPRATSLDGAVRYPDLFGDPDAEAVLEPTTVSSPRDPAASRVRLREPEPEPEPEPEVVEDLLEDHPFEPEPALAPVPVPTPVAPEPEPEPADAPELPVGEAALDEGDVDWIRPKANLLTRSAAADARPDTAGNELVAKRLVEALAHFNVEAQVVGTVSGPHITRYELRLAPGIKMSKVAQMKDDLAYALAATDIRILAPIPGKQAVGVEVPNLKRKMVTLGDVYGEAPEGSSPLTVWLGKDVSGKAIHADLAKMPHILVAGTTGAGKSGCINAMLSSILLRATPEEVRLILVDPKQVELNHYEAVPHLLTPVITAPRAAANALQNLVREMEWRYGIMSMARTRSLPELNRHRLANEQEPLPYILCVIDELADLMMVAPADVEDSIIRIAQKARAVGIHLVLATQSPRVDVITGMIKANVPSRIAFSVSSQTDSRVILDQNGAESLLGMGDMLFSAVGSSKLHRIQGAYIDEPQIAMLTEFWARQGEPELREELLQEVEAEAGAERSPEDGMDPDEDPLLGEAIELVVEMGTASTSMLQRRLRLGYTRAGRLIDMLERRSVISGYEGSKPRMVLIGPSELPRVLAGLKGGDPAELGGPELPDADVVLGNHVAEAGGDDLPE